MTQPVSILLIVDDTPEVLDILENESIPSVSILLIVDDTPEAAYTNEKGEVVVSQSFL